MCKHLKAQRIISREMPAARGGRETGFYDTSINIRLP